MKRILLFVLTNFAVMAVLLVTTRILGVDRYLTANGLNMTALAGFSLIMGFGGATISLITGNPRRSASMMSQRLRSLCCRKCEPTRGRWGVSPPARLFMGVPV